MTEIQRVPGSFTLPAGWPKMEFPDITSNLLHDWVADDLTVGSNVKTWADRISGRSLSPATHATAPWEPLPVVSINGGHKAVRFNGASRLDADVNFPADLTVCMVYKMNEASAASARLLSGGDSFRTWMTGSSATGRLTINMNSGTALMGEMTVPGAKRDVWQAAATAYSAGRAADNKMVAQILGDAVVSGPLGTQAAPSQKKLFIGFNPATPPSPSVGLVGEVARIMVWGRALSEMDMREVLRQRGVEYSL